MSSDVKKTKKAPSSYVKKPVNEFSENPWARDLHLTLKRGSKIVAMGKSNKIMDLSSGELLDQDVAMVSKKIVDKTEFIKIFEGGISHLFSLTKPAQEIFQIVLMIYLNDKFIGDRIYLSSPALLKAGYSRSRPTQTSALNELLTKGFLARVTDEKSMYWVNPNMFFKGDRMRIVNEYAVEGTASADNMKEEQDNMVERAKQLALSLEQD